MLVAQSCATLCDPMDSSQPGSSGCLGKNTGVGSHSLLQGIFSTQGLGQAIKELGKTNLFSQPSPFRDE